VPGAEEQPKPSEKPMEKNPPQGGPDSRGWQEGKGDKPDKDAYVAYQDRKAKQDPPAKPGQNVPQEPPPVTITVVGNKLFINSADPDALQLATELYRLLTQSPGEGDFKVIKLKNANATEAAKVLDEVFNGPRPTQQQGGGGGGRGNRGGGGGGGQQGGP